MDFSYLVTVTESASLLNIRVVGGVSLGEACSVEVVPWFYARLLGRSGSGVFGLLAENVGCYIFCEWLTFAIFAPTQVMPGTIESARQK